MVTVGPTVRTVLWKQGRVGEFVYFVGGYIRGPLVAITGARACGLRPGRGRGSVGGGLGGMFRRRFRGLRPGGSVGGGLAGCLGGGLGGGLVMFRQRFRDV